MLKTSAINKNQNRKAEVRLRNAKAGCGMQLYHCEMALCFCRMLMFGSGTQNSEAKRFSTLCIGISRRYKAICYGFT
ncbi:MAG TPA: hypothetical protein VKA38_11740 [Draconibacterium sp.]|nr:hypothetical protein [Draconibacterium sp.]